MTGVVKGHRCPKCGDPIVYNGNYYCKSRETGGRCRWVMTAESRSVRDRVIIRDYLRQCVQENPSMKSRYETYLANFKDLS